MLQPLSIEKKPWGTSRILFTTANVEVYRIEVDTGGYCSRHMHLSKHNLFYVESGELHVQTFEPELSTKILLSGDILSIPPNILHQFYAKLHTIALEIYHVEMVPDDIIRFSVGGLDARV